MAFDLRPTKDVLLWPGNANMAFDLRPTKDVLLWPGNANMAFDLRPTEDVLPWPGNANMAFDLRPTEDVLPWPGNANMAFDLRPTEDVLPWPGNANMAFDLRPTEDVLPWPGELGGSIRRALQAMSNATIIDEQVLNECLKEITRALLQHDVHVKLVHTLQTNIKNIVNLPDLAAGHNKRKIIQQAIFNALCEMLDPGKLLSRQERRTQVLSCPRLRCPYKLGMILGSGKTTTCTKYAYHHQKKGWKPALAQLRSDGIFEILQKPDLVIFVMDSSIGQAAFDQAQAFKESVAVGAVIVTKMDGHAKGGGALSAVAATKSPVMYIGTGEHMVDFKVFDVKPFVSGLLGMGDWSGFMNKIQEVVPMDQQPELLQKLSEGNFTLRIMYEQYHNILEMGPIDQLASMLPVFNAELMPKGQEKESQAKIKRYMTMMDSMTNEELDSTNPKLMNESRIMRIARGSGRLVRDVMDMLEEYKRLATMMKGLKIPKKGKMSSLSRNMNVQQMSKALPPGMLPHLEGMGGLPTF
ncbi:signal recognition particle 54 kDa protein 2 [Tanacetum coccineum]